LRDQQPLRPDRIEVFGRRGRSMPVATVSSETAGFFLAIAFAELIAFR
jgi:hypothetical protein